MGPIRTTITVRGVLAAASVPAVAVALTVSSAAAETEAPARSAEAPAAATAPAATLRAAPTRKATSRLKVSKARRTVVLGNSALVKGRLEPNRAGRSVVLQIRKGSEWTTVARDRTSRGGAFRLRYKPRRASSAIMRVAFGGDRSSRSSTRRIGRLNVYRRALASWYGPGLYGGHLACGGRLSQGTLGVAHKHLPCGTRVTLRYRGRSVRVPVVDRGPYVGAREFDLTSRTKQALGFAGTGTVLSTR